MGEIVEHMASPDEEGVTIALSAVQMAAVMEWESIEQRGKLTNRIMGGLRILGCAGEASAAGVLAAAPEPTMLTKVAAVGAGLFAADQCTTGARQLWYGSDHRSLLDRSTSSLALQLGASPQTAANVGLASEIIVPLGAASLAGAVRVIAVRSGRISLALHEAVEESKKDRLGGHTLEHHVDKTEEFLRERLAKILASGKPKIPKAVSAFSSLRVAETEIPRALQANKSLIAQWSQTARHGSRLLPPIRFDSGKVIGHGVMSATGEYVPMTEFLVVLRKGSYNGMPYYILAAYPAP